MDYYCNNHGIALVLKFNNDPVNPEKPDDVLRVINSPVVFHTRPTDITPFIIDSLRQRGAIITAPATASRQSSPSPFGVYPNH